MHTNNAHFLMQLATDLVGNKDREVVYIAGKVTGLPDDEVREKFAAAQAKLEAQGFKVLNPVTYINNVKAPWCQAMRVATILLNVADHIYMLTDWKDSEGATCEHSIAKKYEINIMYQGIEPGKGDYNGECYKTACKNKPALYFHMEQERYFCQCCAITTNEMNYLSAQKKYGHAMCIKGIYKGK